MAKYMSPLLCALALLAVLWRAHGQGFDLEDALDDVPTKKPKPATKPPKFPSHGTGDFELSDFLDATEPPKVVPKPPPKRPDIFIPTTKPRRPTIKPPKKPEPKDPNNFDLSDALDEKNDPPAGVGGGGGGGARDFSDSDLDNIYNDGYRPDKGKGGGGGGNRGSGGAGENDNTGAMAETGTIAGIASTLALALISAVSGYISYQQKKFCFSIQQGLNAEYVKGENMEGVVSEEPPPSYSKCVV